MKRCAELGIPGGEKAAATSGGRDYRITDLVVLWPLGVGAALSAVVVLFVHHQRAGDTDAIWNSTNAVVRRLWVDLSLARLWVKTSRGYPTMTQ